MRASILGVSSKEPTKVSADPLTQLDDKPEQTVDPIDIETPDHFIMRFHAQDTKENGYIETNPSVFKHFVGNQKTDYFWYGGIRVYVKGTRAEIEAKEGINMHQKIFGTS